MALCRYPGQDLAFGGVGRAKSRRCDLDEVALTIGGRSVLKAELLTKRILGV